MHSQKQTKLIIPLSAILIVLVFGMMTIEPRFFELTEEQRQDIYTQLDNNWHRIDLIQFTVKTPKDFKFYQQQGIDSYIGLITNETDSIEFDYGIYSNDLTSEDWHLTTERVNGRKAVIGYSNSFGTAAHFPNLGNNNSLTVYARTMSEEEALEIFRTIEILN
ncbi:hypothetical protein [Fulvivirga lutea]|uniref:Uncharacterized protein n=1 Tax=Fulvivirga lutea TaxID=2810512 RepID=A0A975A1A5_9BACT|nr:hypothetical protein [Fulvivirga lutea]QSE98035.1 hypothetical protein JR347_02840 [Fulvivirga lutea]